MIDCSIGVFAYNEAQNIGHLLYALQNQVTQDVNIKEIIVVSSASTDKTDEITEQFAEKDSRIRLITEKKRNGKSTAINLFIKEAKSNILVIESADTIPENDVIEKLVSPFSDNKIGMTGGKPLPVNNENTFIGYAVHLLWRLHHQMALISPKLGEMVAFRKVFDAIPPDSAVDEASIEALIREKGLILRYIPEAIINNKGPENLQDFLKQRRRIAAGHLWLKEHNNYSVSSSDPGILIKIAIKELLKNPIKILKFKAVFLLEIYSRILGWYDYSIKKKNPFKWDIATTTKKLR